MDVNKRPVRSRKAAASIATDNEDASPNPIQRGGRRKKTLTPAPSTSTPAPNAAAAGIVFFN